MSIPTAEPGPRNPQLLVRLAGIVLFLQLLTALMESVGSHVRDRELAAAQAHIGGLLAASASALEVRVRFKLQVQEWKNILLRGSDPADFSHYHDAMLGHAAAVDAALHSLGESLAALDESTAAVPQLLERHAALDLRYTEALGDRQTLDFALAQQVDRGVRGIDRPLDAEFDALATELGARAHAAQADALDVMNKTVHRARIMRGVLLGVSSVLVLLMLAMALRRI